MMILSGQHKSLTNILSHTEDIEMSSDKYGQTDIVNVTSETA